MPFISTFGSGSAGARGFGRARLVLSALFDFTSATFTPGGNTGRFGPSLTQARSGLSGPEVNDWKNDTAFFNTSNGVQLWTVPADGNYRIKAAGAEGGQLGGGTGAGLQGRGALVESVFSLTVGEKIQIVVGQEGQTPANQTGGGGGGGSYVVDESNNPLLIAGGGGGENTGSDRHLDGFASNYRGEGGGFIGHGSKGAGGGGFQTDGDPSAASPGRSFVNGSQGGTGSSGGDGGFGGGGGAGSYGSQGGGGGYAGGVGADGPFTNTSFYSGSGPYQNYSSTSFSSESFTVQNNGGNTGIGYVEISLEEN